MAAAFTFPLALSFAPKAHAQGKPLACQFIVNAGLDWEQGRWNVRRFVLPPPFILVLKGEEIDPASVSRPLGTTAACVKPDSVFQRTYCYSEFGGYLMFNHRTNQGAVSQTLGAEADGDGRRDSLFVSPFSCSPY